MMSGIGHAHVGPRDLSGYIGTDTLQTPAGKPKQVVLPAAFLDFDTSGVATLVDNATLIAGSEDATYSVNISAAGGVHVYSGANNFTTCLVHVNGYISCGGGATDFLDNRSLPDARLGGSTIFAPFWDDLIPVKDESTIETYQSAGVFFAVQWNNFSLYNDPTARLTFRVVFEVSATARPTAVWFQYITMQSTSGAAADGSSATIGIQNANGWSANQYSFNTTGAVISTKMAPGPTAPPLPAKAVQAVLFDFDGDGDRLSQLLESSAYFKTDDANHDFDSDGQDDGVEVANGDDPTGTGTDPVALDGTDNDSDTLSAAEEAFYGTDPNKADTDGDTTATTSMNDADEIYTHHTDPARTDTDRDQFDDGAEIDAITNPLDPTNHPAYPITNLAVSGVAKYRPTAAVDANGYVHACAGDEAAPAVFYYMVNPDGTVRIPETLIKAPPSGNFTSVHDTAITVYAGKIYIVYKLLSGSTGALGLLRLDPSKAAQDGSPIVAPTIVELSKILTTDLGARVPNHPAIAVGADGIHVVYRGDELAGETAKTGWYYSGYDLDGNLKQTFQIGDGGQSPGGDNSQGLDRKSRAAIALDADGAAHILVHNRSGAASAEYYARVTNGQLVGPYALHSITETQVGIAAQGKLVYLSSTGGGGGHAGLRGGVNLAILDPAQLSATTTKPDAWGVTASVDLSSMPLPFTSVYLHSDATKGGAIAVMGNGAAVVAFKSHQATDNCFGVFAPNGASLGTPFCVTTGAHFKGDSNPIPLLLPGNRVGVVFSGGRNVATVRYASFSLSGFDFSSVPPAPALNAAPVVTSTPPTTATIGVAYSYMAMATDAETPAAQLVWSLVSGPTGLTVSSGGAVSWTPASADLGTQQVVIQVCDDGSPQRCTQHAFSVEVSSTPPANLPPEFTSIPSTVAVQGRAYTYQAVAVDPDEPGTTFTYSLASTPSGNLAVSSSGALTWMPTKGELGSVNVTIVAMGSNGQMAIQNFTVSVLSKNIESSGGGCGCVLAGHTGGDGPTPLTILTVALIAAGLLFRSRRRRLR